MISFFLSSLLTLAAVPHAVFSLPPLSLKDPRFQYTVSAPTSADHRTLAVKAKAVQAKSTQQPQLIPLTGPAAQEPAQNITLRDVNFDGQPDLMITSARGNVNSQYAYWLYDAPTKRFVLNPAMSNALGGYEVTFNSAKQEIVTANRFTCCEHETRTYAFQQGKLKLLATKTDKVVPTAAH